MFKIAPVGVAGCIAVGLANGAVWTLAPVYAHDHHLTKGLLALFMNAFTLGGAFIQIPVGRLSDHVDRRHIIAGASLLAAGVGLALAAFGERSQTWAIVIVGIFGMTALPMYGLSIAHANDRLPREMFVEASATLLLINAIASAFGPILAALVTDRMGIAWLFVYTAGIHVLLAAFVIARLAVKEPPPDESREPFEPMPEAGSPMSIELDPRRPEAV
jgi:MFS family permease